MKKLVKTATVDTGKKEITLIFSEKLTLSHIRAAKKDLISYLKVGATEYTIGPCTPDPANDDENKKWIVSYTGTSMKKKKGTVIDTDEVVVVIETRELLAPLEIEDKETMTKKSTKKKVTKSSPVKKKSNKK